MIGTRRKLYVLFLVALTFGFVRVITGYLIRYEQLRTTELEIQFLIEEEEMRQEELANELEYNQSDAFIEKIARERLNLVMPDEILFYNDDQ